MTGTLPSGQQGLHQIVTGYSEALNPGGVEEAVNQHLELGFSEGSAYEHFLQFSKVFLGNEKEIP